MAVQQNQANTANTQSANRGLNPNEQLGSGFTNVGRFLQANDATAFAQDVQGKLADKVKNLGSNLQSETSNIRNQLNAATPSGASPEETKAYLNSLLSNIVGYDWKQDPSTVLQSKGTQAKTITKIPVMESDINRVKNILGGDTSGIAKVKLDNPESEASVKKVQQFGQGGGKDYSSTLKDLYASPKYSQASSALDAMFLRQSPTFQSDIRQETKGLGRQLESAQTERQGAKTQALASIGEQQASAKKALEDKQTYIQDAANRRAAERAEFAKLREGGITGEENSRARTIMQDILGLSESDVNALQNELNTISPYTGEADALKYYSPELYNQMYSQTGLSQRDNAQLAALAELQGKTNNDLSAYIDPTTGAVKGYTPGNIITDADQLRNIHQNIYNDYHRQRTANLANMSAWEPDTNIDTVNYRNYLINSANSELQQAANALGVNPYAYNQYSYVQPASYNPSWASYLWNN